MNKVKHNLRGSWLVLNEITSTKTDEAIAFVSYWGPYKDQHKSGAVMNDGTIVRRLEPTDKGYLPLHERIMLQTDNAHVMPDFGETEHLSMRSIEDVIDWMEKNPKYFEEY